MSLSPDSCPSCGKQGLPAGPWCPACGQSLLVDVVITAPVTNSQQRYEAARAVSGLGPPAPDFRAADARLATPHAVVVARTSRDFARRALLALEVAGVTAAATAHSARRRPVAASLVRLLATLVVLGGLAALVVYAQRLSDGTWSPKWSSLFPPGRAAPPSPAPPPLTTAQIGERANAAIAQVTCRDAVGAAFFVDAQEAITNAHVACPLGESQEVLLKDGRRLSAVTVWRDEWADLARLSVLGANATALEVGEAAALAVGDPVVFIGSPHGLAFTVHEGKISFVGRNVRGLAYLQLNGTVNPGNSGGPVLDARGRVVGVVTLKLTDVEGIGLAVPIQYAVPPPGGVDGGAAPSRRWAGLLDRVAEENRRDLQKARREAEQGTLLGLSLGEDDAPVGEFLMHLADGPRDVSLELTLEVQPGTQCLLRAKVRDWTLLSEAPRPHGDQARYLEWLLHADAGAGLYAATGRLALGTCDGVTALRTATLRVKGGPAGAPALQLTAEQANGLVVRLQDLGFEGEPDAVYDGWDSPP